MATDATSATGKVESKIDAAAEKAFAEAAAKKAAEAVKPAPAAAPALKAAPAPKAAAKKVAPKPVAKPVAKKTPAKAAAKQAAAPKKAATPAKKIAKPVKKPVAAKTTTPVQTTNSIRKETIMTEAKDKVAEYTAQLKEGLADLQTRAKTAYDKSSEIAAEMGEFSKGNIEAVIELGKILAAGVQEMAKTYLAEGKTAVETVTADVKEMASVKSPTEFVQLQGKIASRNFDATVAQLSKTTEAWVKLANDTFAPLSTRMSLAIEKVRKAA